MNILRKTSPNAKKIKKLVALDCQLVLSPPCRGQTVPARITDVYDGDTVTAVYMINTKTPFLTKIRLDGIDTPEIRTRNLAEKTAGLLVRDHVIKLLLEQMVQIKIIDWDKFGGRIIGRIYRDDKDISAELIKLGLAKAYDGGKKEDWNDKELDKISEFFLKESGL